VDEFILMSLHVDDFYVVSTRKEYLDELYDLLIEEYGEVTRKSGDILSYLGMSVNRNDNGSITITQPAYIDKMLSIANMTDAKGIQTPLPTIYSYNAKDNIAVDKNEYLKFVGLNNYLAMYTRPDLAYSLSSIAQKCSNPTKADLKNVQRIFRYIISTREYGITFYSDDDYTLCCHVDASYNCYTDGKSHYGYTISLGRDNGSFVCKSAKIKLVTTSSTEAEYVAMYYACTELLFLRRLLSDIGMKKSKESSIIYEDNMSTIDQAWGKRNHNVTKLIRPKYNLAFDLLKEMIIKIRHISTKYQIADVLTKALSRELHTRFTSALLNKSD
jgi:hypothetical protein